MHAARKDSAVHVSLSSDSPVKQPGAHAVPLSSHAREPTKPLPPTRVDGRSPVSVKSFGGAPFRRAAAHRAEDLYAAPLHIVNHISEGFHQLVPSSKWTSPTHRLPMCRDIGSKFTALEITALGNTPPLPYSRHNLAACFRYRGDAGAQSFRLRYTNVNTIGAKKDTSAAWGRCGGSSGMCWKESSLV